MTNRGRIPDSWAECRIEDIFATLEDGRTLHQGWSPQCESYPSPSEEIWGALRTTAIQPNSFHDEHNKCLPDKLDPRPLLEVRVGDILITCAGPRARCGIACLVRAVRPRLMISGKMYRFRMPEASVEPRFVEYFLQTPEAQAAIDRMKTGGSDSGLNLTHDRFRQLVVRLAPRNEQSRIVQEIDKQFTRLDAAEVALKRVQANLKRYRAAVLKAACEGRLVPTEAELARREGRSYEPASVLLERIVVERRSLWEASQLRKFRASGKVPKDDGWKTKYIEPVAPNSNAHLPLPGGWTWSTVDQLSFVESGQTPKGIEERLKGEGVLPWFRVGDMNTPGNEHHMQHGNSWLSKNDASALGLHIHPAGTIIFPKRGGAIATNKKRILNGPSCYDLNTMGLTPVSGEIANYLWSWFTSVDLGRLGDGSNVPQINHGDIEPLLIPLPPSAEQGRIVIELERRLSILDELQLQVQTDTKRAERLRQTILKSAFEGKLVAQDPNEEPATVLLRRFRTERESQSKTAPGSTFKSKRRANANATN